MGLSQLASSTPWVTPQLPQHRFHTYSQLRVPQRSQQAARSSVTVHALPGVAYFCQEELT